MATIIAVKSFIIQAPGVQSHNLLLNEVHFFNTSVN
jgi:hypothetical protein